MSARGKMDCRDCLHGGKVIEGVSVQCISDPPFPMTMSWGNATDGTTGCPEFIRNEASPRTDGHGADNVEAGTKDSNPKDIIGSTKLPLDLVPSLTIAYASLAHLNGMLKYGKANWRKCGVRASIYGAACMRHVESWLEGEEFDPDDGVPHLSAALACIGIILDSRAAGMLTDDRMLPNPGMRAEMLKLTEHVKRLQELHKDKKPKHFLITDSEVA
jgi:hypothetical protein